MEERLKKVVHEAIFSPNTVTMKGFTEMDILEAKERGYIKYAFKDIPTANGHVIRSRSLQATPEGRAFYEQ